MPSRFALEIACSAPLEWRPHQLVAVAAGWLDDPAGGDIAPHGAPVRPWSVSPPIDLGRRRYRLEFGLVRDELTQRLVRAAERHGDGGIHFGHVKRIRAKVVGSGKPLTPIAVEPWEHLVETSRPVRRLHFNFLSPTTFHSGQRYVPLSYLPSIIESYVAGWTLGPVVPREVDARALEIEGFELRTVTTEMRVGDGDRRVTRRVVGFVGDLVVGCGKLGKADRRALDMTCRIAGYAGTGALTTYGFGDTYYEGEI